MAEKRLIDVGGVRIAYQVLGPPDAAPLVLLHGLGETGEDWDVVAPHYAVEWRVHALDLRGHGQSDWPGAYSLELMRDDIAAFLDALHLDRVDLIGHSMGGYIALLFAERHPRRVNRLVLEDVGVPRPRERKPVTRPDGELSMDWAMVTAIKAQVDTPDPIWLDELSEITAETLVVGGGPTSHVPQKGIDELVERVQRGHLVTIPAGHCVHTTEPVAFVQVTLDFLRSHGAPEPEGGR